MRTFWSIIIVAGTATIILWMLESRPTVPEPGPAGINREFSINQSMVPGDTTASTGMNPTPQAPTAESRAGDLPEASADPEPEAETEPTPTTELAGVEGTPADAPRTDAGIEKLSIGLDRTIAHAKVVPGDIVRTGPSELRADGAFELEGSGTREDPYQPSWEYLYSAGDTYKPRLGEDALPQRIALLDDSWVTIAGHTAFPLVTGESSEMLVMLNQWDGCCIGVPPTPFDAIEVRLQKAVPTGPKHSFNFGTVTGRLKVDPYLIQDWLVGLYILEESELEDDL